MKLHFTDDWLRAHIDDDEPGGLMACSPGIYDFLTRKENEMHYRNGREAKNGDKIVKLNGNGKLEAFGVLHSATPGNDYCNGNIAIIQHPQEMACMCDCLHADDVAEILAEKGLGKRPEGK